MSGNEEHSVPNPPSDVSEKAMAPHHWGTIAVQKAVQRFESAKSQKRTHRMGEHSVAHQGCIQESIYDASSSYWTGDVSPPGPRLRPNHPPQLEISDSDPEDSYLSTNGASCTDKYLQVQNLKEAELQFIKTVHHAIVQKLNSYGIVLTLLASVTFMAILQPAGGFDSDGKLRSPVLVGCFILFSTLSFLLACTGLLAVVVGTASLFRPGFFLNLDSNFANILSKIHPIADIHEGDECVRNSGNQDSELDDPAILASFVLGNLHRVWRLRVYLVLSLVFCIVAFACGAFAIATWAENYNCWLLVGAICGGLLALLFEIFKTGTGLTPQYPRKWLQVFQMLPRLDGSSSFPELSPVQDVSGVLRGFSQRPRSKAGTPRTVGNSKLHSPFK